MGKVDPTSHPLLLRHYNSEQTAQELWIVSSKDSKLNRPDLFLLCAHMCVPTLGNICLSAAEHATSGVLNPQYCFSPVHLIKEALVQFFRSILLSHL